MGKFVVYIVPGEHSPDGIVNLRKTLEWNHDNETRGLIVRTYNRLVLMVDDKIRPTLDEFYRSCKVAVALNEPDEYNERSKAIVTAKGTLERLRGLCKLDPMMEKSTVGYFEELDGILDKDSSLYVVVDKDIPELVAGSGVLVKNASHHPETKLIEGSSFTAKLIEGSGFTATTWTGWLTPTGCTNLCTTIEYMRSKTT